MKGMLIGVWAVAMMLLLLPVQASRWQNAGTHQVQVHDEEWIDAARSRTVPVRIYAPVGNVHPSPVIVFSHGLGGTREAAGYLGRHWASHNYVAVHVQHEGSDSSILGKGGGRLQEVFKNAASGQNAAERARDVRFVLDQLGEKTSQPGPWKGRLDLTRVGMSGHSFGAHTTMLLVGQKMPALGAGKAQQFFDPRIRAAVALSCPPPVQRQNLQELYAPVSVPVLHMTGTHDDSPLGDTKAFERRIPYDATSTGSQYLVTFVGGDHMIFSGRKNARRMASRNDDKFHQLIQECTTAFWDAWLRGNPEARRWLQGEDGMRATLRTSAQLEMK